MIPQHFLSKTMKTASLWMVTLFILLVFNPLPVISRNEPYFFKHLDINNGISQNSIMCILQDKKGFMWFGTKEGLNRYDGMRFKVYTPDNTGYQLGDCIISALCEDKKGNIWIGTDKGLSVYNPETETINKLSSYTNNEAGFSGRIKSVIVDRNGLIWIAEEFKGIFTFNPTTNELSPVNKENDASIFHPVCIFEDKDGLIWVGTVHNGFYLFNRTTGLMELFPVKNENSFSLQIEAIVEYGRELFLGTFNRGLLKLNKETQEITPIIKNDDNNNILHIHAILKNGQDEIWIGSETGLHIYSLKTQEYTHFIHSYIDKYALSDNVIYSICKDRDGGIWLGTYFGGVNYLPYQYTPFYKYYPLKDNNSISGKAVREFCEDNRGYIWIGTEDAGLNRFDPRTRKFNQFMELNKKQNYFNIHALQSDGENLWVGTFTDGLYLIDSKGNQLKHYDADKSPREVFTLLKDRTGKLWMGAFQGAFVYDKGRDMFTQFDEIGNYFIYDIKEDHSGNIWFSAITFGVICYNPVTKEMKRYRNNPEDLNSISSKIIGIYVDKQNNVWLSSEGQGLYRYNREKDNFKRYSVENGLPNNVVYYLTQDLNGDLWFGTNKGLVNLNPETEQIKTFTTENGLICDQFNYKSAYTAKDGTIYMGTINGMISFNPLLFKENTKNSVPMLTGFQIFNKEVSIGADSPLEKSVSLTSKVTLKYNQNTISFDIASLNYNSSNVDAYLYMLEGLDADWVKLKDNPKISYSNLLPGKYKLRVKSANSDEERMLNIIIRPPFWLSVYAYIVYLIIFIVAVFFIFRGISARIHKKHRKDIETLEAEREKETYDAKISFFTNVAHEIRTPLSLIKAPLEHILKQNKVDSDTREDLIVMQRNSDRLLSLINQLLDFRKTESGKFILNFYSQNIDLLLQSVYERFSPVLRQKGINLNMDIPAGSFHADVDAEAFTKIISNLFTNALKYAGTFVELKLMNEKPDSSHFTVVMKNDGQIIAKEMFDKIFEPFFQVNSLNGEITKTGTGIGLSLSRSLAELHNGKLYITYESDQYNTFILELPNSQPGVEKKLQQAEKKDTEQLPLISQADKAEQYSILVVEDNLEMQDFIRKKLVSEYFIHSALNGKEALELLEQEHIDLIISDIAMPEMDGFEFLQKMKSDIRYSHIPVILLTAQTNLQSKIEGLELGADAYIEKPFSIDFICVQIKNLLEGRKKLRDSFVNSPHLHTNSVALTKADEAFMEQINSLIEQNMNNANFNIDYITENMNTSRSSLLRKIKGISGLTVNEYIRLIRLKKAAQLLEEGKYRVNEICFLTGFSSTSYFAKSFQKQFGVLPKEFMNTVKGEKE